jgi:hypothetical protein
MTPTKITATSHCAQSCDDAALQKQKRMIRKTMAAWRNAMVIR